MSLGAPLVPGSRHGHRPRVKLRPAPTTSYVTPAFGGASRPRSVFSERDGRKRERIEKPVPLGKPPRRPPTSAGPILPTVCCENCQAYLYPRCLWSAKRLRGKGMHGTFRGMCWGERGIGGPRGRTRARSTDPDPATGHGKRLRFRSIAPAYGLGLSNRHGIARTRSNNSTASLVRARSTTPAPTNNRR